MWRIRLGFFRKIHQGRLTRMTKTNRLPNIHVVFRPARKLRDKAKHNGIGGSKDFVFMKEGFRMVRFFGFVLAMASMLASADAALLAQFHFTNGTGGTGNTNRTSSQAEVLSAGLVPPSNFDINTSGTNSFGINTNTSIFTSRQQMNSNEQFTAGFGLELDPVLNVAGGGYIVVTGAKVAFRSSAALAGSGAALAYNLKLNGESVASRSTSSTGAFDEVLVSFNKSYDFNSSSGLINAELYGNTVNSTTTTARLQVEYIELYGYVVPEPASMAIFGLMGAGFAVRRIRRKA
jgi:hypothetical protein